MKVFNKEVEECCLCPCLDHLDMDGSPYCNILQEDIKDCNIIHKDCPFNKPVTKEVIEGFGFKYLRKGWSENSKIYRKNRGEGFEIYSRNNESFHITKANGLVLFEGAINNLVELEFILRSVGVIESK